MSTESEVREASKRFYTALNRMIQGDAGSLSEIWAHGTTVTTMHPIGGLQVGWTNVLESFQQVAQIASAGHVALEDQIIQVAGDLAYELGAERGEVTLAGQKVTLDHRVTNVYRRETTGWKIVHHHTDVSAAMLDVLKRLQSET